MSSDEGKSYGMIGIMLIHKLSSACVFYICNFLRQLIKVERKLERYIYCLENDSRVLDSLCINGEYYPRGYWPP